MTTAGVSGRRQARTRWQRRYELPDWDSLTWPAAHPDRLVFLSCRDGVRHLRQIDLASATERSFAACWPQAWMGRVSTSGEYVLRFRPLGAPNEYGHWSRQRIGSLEPAVDLAPDLGPTHALGLPLVPAHDDWVLITHVRRGRYAIVRAAPGRPTAILDAGPHLRQLAALSADGRLVAVTSYDGDGCARRNRILDTSTGADAASRPLLEFGGRIVNFAPAAGDVRVACEDVVGGFTTPVVWDPVGGEITPLAPPTPGDSAVCDWWPDGDALLVRQCRNGVDLLYRVELRAGTIGLYRLLAVPPGTIAGARVRADGAVWAVWSDGLAPVSVLIVGERSADEHPRLAPQRILRGYESRRVVAESRGVEVDAFVTVPRRRRDRRMLVWLHGGPHMSDGPALSPLTAAFVDHGATLVRINYRGSTGRGVKFAAELAGAVGDVDVADCLAILDRISEWEFYPGSRQVAVGGVSYGATLALLLASCAPERFDAAIAVTPICDWSATYATASPPYDYLPLALMGGTPTSSRRAYERASPRTHLEQLLCPVLIRAGRHDPRAPLGQVEDYVNEARRQGKRVVLDAFDDGHGPSSSAELWRTVTSACAFIGLATKVGR